MHFGATDYDLAQRPPGANMTEFMYRTLQKWANKAEMENNSDRAGKDPRGDEAKSPSGPTGNCWRYP